MILLVVTIFFTSINSWEYLISFFLHKIIRFIKFNSLLFYSRNYCMDVEFVIINGVQLSMVIFYAEESFLRLIVSCASSVFLGASNRKLIFLFLDTLRGSILWRISFSSCSQTVFFLRYKFQLPILQILLIPLNP